MGDMRKLGWRFSEETDSEEQAEADRQTASLAGLAVSLLLIVLGLFLVQELHAKSQLEDCLLSGQRHCIPDRDLR